MYLLDFTFLCLNIIFDYHKKEFLSKIQVIPTYLYLSLSIRIVILPLLVCYIYFKKV